MYLLYHAELQRRIIEGIPTQNKCLAKIIVSSREAGSILLSVTEILSLSVISHVAHSQCMFLWYIAHGKSGIDLY
jgi:hypothetical protein